MFEWITGRNALTDEEIESTLIGLADNIALQVGMVSRLTNETKSYMKTLTAAGYFHAYVFGIGARAAQRACDLFNIKESCFPEQKHRVISRLFSQVFGDEADSAMRMFVRFADVESQEFHWGLEDGRADVENVHSDGEFVRLLFRRAVLRGASVES